MRKIFILTLGLLLCVNKAFSQNNWSEWAETDCLKGLDFRTRIMEYNSIAKKYKWQVQFRNRYKENIHFSYIMVESSKKSQIISSNKTTGRIHANSNGGTVGGWELLNEKVSIYIHINKIRISKNDDLNIEYYKCDK